LAWEQGGLPQTRIHKDTTRIYRFFFYHGDIELGGEPKKPEGSGLGEIDKLWLITGACIYTVVVFVKVNRHTGWAGSDHFPFNFQRTLSTCQFSYYRAEET